MMKIHIWAILLFGSVIFSRASAFSSLYVFGDGICTTTNNTSPSKSYYGRRYTNGRTWVEVLAQRQGLTYDPNKNWSFYGDYSWVMAANVNHFVVPPDVASSLFVVWAGDADLVWDMSNIYPSLTLSDWNSAINSSLAYQFNIITNLYAKGVRTLVVPNAVDTTEIPAFDNMAASTKNFLRGRVIYFNTNLLATVNRAKAACPGLTIYVPDVFSLLDNVLTNASSYNLVNQLYNQGSGSVSIDAIDYYPLVHLAAATNGLGTNFIFWDQFDITAAMHEVLADTVQQMISPVRVGGVAQINGSDRVDVVNMPVGLNGFLENSTNLAAGWTMATNFNSIATAQSIFVPTPPLPPNFGAGGGSGGGGSIDPGNPGTNAVSGSPLVVNVQFYRLRFPYTWSWP